MTTGMLLCFGIGMVVGRCLPRKLTWKSVKDYFMLRGSK